MLVEAVYGAYAALLCSVAYLYGRLLVQAAEGGREELCSSTGRIITGVAVLSVGSALFALVRILFFRSSFDAMPPQLMAFLSIMVVGWIMLSANWFMDGTKVNKHRAIMMASWLVAGASANVIIGVAYNA